MQQNISYISSFGRQIHISLSHQTLESKKAKSEYDRNEPRKSVSASLLSHKKNIPTSPVNSEKHSIFFYWSEKYDDLSKYGVLGAGRKVLDAGTI